MKITIVTIGLSIIAIIAFISTIAIEIAAKYMKD